MQEARVPCGARAFPYPERAVDVSHRPSSGGLTPEQVYVALGTGPATGGPNVDSAALANLTVDEAAKLVLKDALRAALRMGHNYIGTEHLLLAVLYAGGPATEAFSGLGLTPQQAERWIVLEIAAFQARRGK